MKTVHTFQASNLKGKIGEQVVETYFRDLGYEVYRLSVSEQKRLMYDLECKRFDKNWLVEVKTELRAEDTGNIFYETVVHDKLGWCLKYESDSDVIIIWYLPITHKFLCFPAKKLKEIDYGNFPYKTVCNTGYTAGGYVIPLTYLEKQCKVIQL